MDYYYAKMVTITVPPEYGWVVLGAGVAPVITSMYLGGFVMKARKEFDVQYPNLYGELVFVTMFRLSFYA